MRLLLSTLLLALSFLASAPLLAQNFLRAEYAGPTGKPSQLNVCGNPDVAVYRVERTAGAPTASAIEVTVELFKGVRAVGLDASRSSPGVSVISLANPSRPVISLPNVSSTNPRVEFALILQARCGILDTIRVNNSLEVRDYLKIKFRAVGSDRTERHAIDPYLGSITFPVFTLNTALNRSPLRVGETVERSVEIANGSFNGYSDTLTYELAQGPGASVREMRVNGIVVPFRKTVTAAGDTLIRVVLSGEHFVGNRNGVGLGDGDTRFDPNERLVLTQTLIISRCADSRLARHTTLFGCDGKACATTTIQSDLPIGSGQPALRITKAPTFPTADVGYCQLGEMELWVSNLGRESDPTFGQARDISISALASFGGLLAANNYKIARVEVAGRAISVLTAVVDLDQTGQFATDPDGAGRGLDDLDGDGAYDDLGLLDSFSVKIFYEFDCTAESVYDIDENCANDASTTFQLFAYFDDACGNRLEGSEPSVHLPRNLQDDFEQRTQPDAYALGAPFQVQLDFGRLVFDFVNNCSASAELRAYVVLPKGVTIDNGTSTLSRGGGTPMPLLGVTYRGDTATLRFSPKDEVALSGEYALTLGLSADCTAPLGETLFPTTVAYYCPDCDCEHVWICEEIVGPWIHKTAPPCLITELYPCPEGIQGTSFEINRTTLGFSDAGFTTPIDPALANTKVALPADSVRIDIDGRVGDGVLSDDIGVILHYFTPTAKEDTAGMFLLNGGTLEWVDAGTVRTCTLPFIPHALQTAADETWQRFDLSACLRANGWVLKPNDVVRFHGMFEINPEGPLAGSYEFVTDLRGGFYANSATGETQCDQFGEVFRVGRPLTVFGTASNDQYPKGCTPSTLEFKLTNVNRGYFAEFGPEFRRAPRLDSIVLTFDTAVFRAFGDLSVDLLVSGHPTQGNRAFAVRPLTDFPDGRYMLQLDSLSYTANLVDNYNSLYSMQVNLAPNCGSIRSSSRGDEYYAMRSEPYYRDRYYAIDIGDGRRVLPVNEPVDFVMTYEDPARLRIDQLTSSYQRIVTDSAYVTLEVCNTSDKSAAGRNWVTFNDTTAILVEEVDLIDDPNNPVRVPIETFRDGHFVNLEGLGAVNGVNSSAQVCNLVRFKVRVGGCGVSSITFATGWSCESTVPPGWTSDQDEACVDDRVLSTFEPIAPFLEADLISQPPTSVDLCTPITMEFQVNNAQLGTSYDVLSQFYVPVGFTYVPGSAEVAYPPTSAYQPVATDATPTPATVRGLGLAFADLAQVHPYLGANGLAGFNVASPNDSSRFVLRMQFETDCEFRSGSLVFLEAEGTEACGTATNLAATESAAIRINGTEPDGTHLYEVGFAPTSRIQVGQPVSTLEVFAANAGTRDADADDVVEVTLPVGYRYDAGSVQGILPQGYSPAEPTIRLMGDVQQLAFAMPVGLPTDDQFRFTIGVRATEAVACGDAAQASLAAYRYLTAACVSQPSTCRIPSDVTVGGLRYEDLSIGDEFFAEEVTNRSRCGGADTEALALSVLLTPNGFALDGSAVRVQLYADLDGDGLISPADTVLEIRSVPTLAGDPSLTYDFAGVVARKHVAALYLRIASAGTGLCADQVIKLALPVLDNAGDRGGYTVCVSDGAAGIVLGDLNCGNGTGLAFSWTSLPAGYESLLRDADAATPTLTFPADYAGPDTLRFVVATERRSLGVTTDTVTVAVSPGIVLAADTDQEIANGAEVVLQPGVLVGRSPLRYSWTPGNGLRDASVAQPIASPTVTTVYTLVVRDALGCSSTNQHTVRVVDQIVATPSVRDTTICPGATVALSVGGGRQVDWSSYPDNPDGLGLSSSSGPSVRFGPTSMDGRYRYLATVSDDGAPGSWDTVTITVRVASTAACREPCAIPRLVSEVVVNSACAVAGGSISLNYSDEIANYTTVWTNTVGRVLTTNTLGLRGVEPGAYTMTATRTEDASCVFTKVAYVNTTDAPLAVVNTIAAAGCGQANGAASINTTGGVAWPDGSAALSRDDLPAGTYWVSVFEGGARSCARFIKVVVPASPGLEVSLTVDRAPSCGRSDGAVTLAVAGGSGDYSFRWAGQGATSATLPAGRYPVTVTDNRTGCTGAASFVLTNESPGTALSVASVIPPACAGQESGGVAYRLTLGSGVAQPLDSAWVDADGQPAINGRMSAGEYCLTIRDASGCLITGACVTLARAPTIAVDLSVGDACGVAGGRVDLRVTDGRTPFTFRFDDGRETGDLSVRDLTVGPQALVITDAAGCVATGAFDVGQCPPCRAFDNASAQTLQTVCGREARLCIPNAREIRAQLQVFDNGVCVTRTLGECASDPTGLSLALASGEHTVIVFDSLSACADTLAVTVVCLPIDTQRVEVVIDSTRLVCLNMANLASGKVVSVTNICPDTSKASYTVTSDSCLLVRGEILGVQTGCWEICSDNGSCDTIIVVVTVTPSRDYRIWRDTVQVGGGGALCLSGADVGLPGDRLTVRNTCVDSGAPAVAFAIDGTSACVEYSGVVTGGGMACLTVCDELGNCASGTLFVTVLPREAPPSGAKLIVYDTVFVDQTLRYCPDPALGTITFKTAVRRHVDARLDSAGSCVQYRGLRIGIDTLDLSVVDRDGGVAPVCVIVAVVPYSGGVIAADDAICTPRNQPVRMNVLSNDEVFGGVASFELVSPPDAELGAVTLNADNTLTFTPRRDVCGRDATFTYRVCNGNTGAADGGCAEATVRVCIECEALMIFTAVTPNGDGKNETFYVGEIERYPDNRLQVFNRWGNLVYETRGYLNDWRGTYNGDPLPDGAYFYLLDVTDGGKTKTYNGYIEIIR